MRKAGVHEKTIMAITGHRTRSMFDRYNIGHENDLRDAAKTSAYVATLPAVPTVVALNGRTTPVGRTSPKRAHTHEGVRERRSLTPWLRWLRGRDLNQRPLGYGSGEQVVADCLRLRHIVATPREEPQAPERGKELRRVADVLAQTPRARA